MLASVTSVQEALIALEAGADIIDLKNPAEGALGALSAGIIREVVDAVGNRAVISATIGDLAMSPELLVRAVANMEVLGIDIIKLGFFGADNHLQCIKAIQPLAIGRLRIVAVLFADQNPDFRLLPELEGAGFYGAMLDTANKDGSSLLNHLSLEDLMVFVKSARSYALISGLAGSLRLEHIPLLAGLGANYLGFRGAMCVNSQRNSPIIPSKIKDIKKLLHKGNKLLDSTAYA